MLFLTGEEEIEDVCRRIRTEAEGLGEEYGPIAVYPLYSSLPPRQQQDIFKDAPAPRNPGGPPGKRAPVMAHHLAALSNELNLFFDTNHQAEK